MRASKGTVGVLAMIVLLSLSFIASAEERFLWNSTETQITISSNMPSPAPKKLSPLHAKLQTWQENSVALFDRFYLIESINHPKRIELDSGFALLFDEKTLESMVFLRDPGASFRYMNGRAEACYVNAIDGVYAQHTFLGSEIEGNKLLDENALTEISLLKEKMKEYGIHIGKPIQMTAYYDSNEGILNQGQFEFLEIAFSQELAGREIMPWGISLYNGLLSSNAYVTVFIDAYGISNVLIRLMLEEIVPEKEQPVLSVEEALIFLEKHVSDLILEKKVIIDHVALEYIPVPLNFTYTDIEILPSWNFYVDYEQDDTRQVFSINAFTGKPL